MTSQESERTISTSTLELDSGWSTVHENISLDDTSSLSASKNIEKSGLWSAHASRMKPYLSGTRSTHESSKGSRLDVSVNIGQKLPLATLDRDVVVLVGQPCSMDA